MGGISSFSLRIHCCKLRTVGTVHTASVFFVPSLCFWQSSCVRLSVFPLLRTNIILPFSISHVSSWLTVTSVPHIILLSGLSIGCYSLYRFQLQTSTSGILSLPTCKLQIIQCHIHSSILLLHPVSPHCHFQAWVLVLLLSFKRLIMSWTSHF